MCWNPKGDRHMCWHCLRPCLLRCLHLIHHSLSLRLPLFCHLDWRQVLQGLHWCHEGEVQGSLTPACLHHVSWAWDLPKTQGPMLWWRGQIHCWWSPVFSPGEGVLWSSSAPIIFPFSLTFSVTWPYVTWSVTWPLSPDQMITWPFSHMTTLIVFTSYCPIAHCPPYMGTLLSLGLLSYAPLFSLVIVFASIVPRTLLFISLGHLSHGSCLSSI